MTRALRFTRKTHSMIITSHVVVLDADDVASEGAFWAAVLGGAVIVEDDWIDITDSTGAVRFSVQHAAHYVAPDGPDGQPQQVHVDLHVADIAESHSRVLELGARVLGKHVDMSAPRGFQVYADPAGHPFCWCWGGG